MEEVEEIKMTPEVQFAQHLAANNPKTRYKALKKLAKWFRSRACGKSFTFDDLMTIWKGLFYCMWMSDKPLVQEKLADHLCDLIHCFGRTETTLTFIDVFFQTMAREWYGIDKFRIEKFMMLIRRFFRQSLHHLKQQQWQVKQVRDFLEILSKSVLSPNCDSTPAGLKMHVADIYLEELARVGGTDFKTKKVLIFLEPYCRIMAQTKDSMMLVSVCKNVFMELVEREESLFPFQIRNNLVANLLVQNASGEEVKIENRNAMYNLVGTFRDAAKGILPSDKIDMEVEFGRVISKKDIDEAAKDLLRDKEKVKRDREKWINRRKRQKRSKGFDELGSNFQVPEVDTSTKTNAKGNRKDFFRGPKIQKQDKENVLKGAEKNKIENNAARKSSPPTTSLIVPTKKSKKLSEKNPSSCIESNGRSLFNSSSLPNETATKPENKMLAVKRNWSEMENSHESGNPKSMKQSEILKNLKKFTEMAQSGKKLCKRNKLPTFTVTPRKIKKFTNKTNKSFSAHAKFVVTPQPALNKSPAFENGYEDKRSDSAREAQPMPGGTVLNGEQTMKKPKIQRQSKTATNSVKTLDGNAIQIQVNERRSAKSVYEALQNETPKSGISNTDSAVANSGKRIDDGEPTINIHVKIPEARWNGNGAQKRRVSFATFENFVKTPPCFFRKSVTKATTPLSGILKKSNVMHSV